MAPVPYDARTGKALTVVSAGVDAEKSAPGRAAPRKTAQPSWKVLKFLKKLEVELLLWKSHFWVYIQKNVKQDPGEVFVHLCYHSVIRSCQEVEATQIFTNC